MSRRGAHILALCLVLALSMSAAAPVEQQHHGAGQSASGNRRLMLLKEYTEKDYGNLLKFDGGKDTSRPNRTTTFENRDAPDMIVRVNRPFDLLEALDRLKVDIIAAHVHSANL